MGARVSQVGCTVEVHNTAAWEQDRGGDGRVPLGMVHGIPTDDVEQDASRTLSPTTASPAEARELEARSDSGSGRSITVDSGRESETLLA